MVETEQQFEQEFLDSQQHGTMSDVLNSRFSCSRCEKLGTSKITLIKLNKITCKIVCSVPDMY